MSSELLAHIPTGAVRAFQCGDVQQTLAELQSKALPFTALKIVSQTWDKLPVPAAVVTDTLISLAQASYAALPAWYGEENIFTSTEGKSAQIHYQALRVRQPAICEPWLKAAINACRSGQLPLPHQFSNALHLAQLALAIAPHKLVLILAINDPQPEEFRLFGFAKAATWIAKETNSRVAALIPTHLIENEELAAILYGAAEFPSLSQLPVEAVTQLITQTVTKANSDQLIGSPQGKPHPGSPGEQQLADRLSRDAELADLFWLNQKVRTVRNRLYRVDLLWLAGKVIVEIDGYHYHGDRDAFREDRNRDYELLISGYIVLRLTHDEVISDIEIAIEKIRDVVRFRRHQQFNQSEV